MPRKPSGHSRRPSASAPERSRRKGLPDTPAHAPEPAAYYPVALDISGRACLVAGGGRVAERKALGLLAARAKVKIVSPALTARLARAVSNGDITHAARKFRATDLGGMFLAIAATGSGVDNARIAGLAKKKGVLVNAVDLPGQGDFIVPSSFRRGPLCISITTSGTSPAMARAIRMEMQALYGPAFGKYLKGLRAVRRKIMDETPEPARREARLKALAGVDVIKKLRRGDKSRPSRPRGKK